MLTGTVCDEIARNHSQPTTPRPPIRSAEAGTQGLTEDTRFSIRERYLFPARIGKFVFVCSRFDICRGEKKSPHKAVKK